MCSVSYRPTTVERKHLEIVEDWRSASCVDCDNTHVHTSKKPRVRPIPVAEVLPHEQRLLHTDMMRPVVRASGPSL